MARTPEPGLTARESELMAVIWEHGKVTVEQLRTALAADLDQALAGSTIRTLLSILEKKGQVQRTRRGKAHVYSAVTTLESAQTEAARTLVQRLFRGTASGLVARLVESDEVSLEELDAVRRQLRRRQSGGRP